MKWLMILFTLLSKHLFSGGDEGHINPVTEIKDFLRENAVKVLLAFILATIMSSLFVAGVVITVVNVSALYDQNLPIVFNATMISGIAMAMTSLLVMVIVYRTLTKERKVVRAEARTPHPTALQESLLLIVNDFVREREFNRSQQTQRSPTTTEEANSAATSHFTEREAPTDKH